MTIKWWTNSTCHWQQGYSSRTGGLPWGACSRSNECFLQTGCHVDFSLASTASLREPARRKKAAECWNRCLPNREKAFFSAAFLHRSSLKLFRKKSVILAFFWDLVKQRDRVSKTNKFLHCSSTLLWQDLAWLQGKGRLLWILWSFVLNVQNEPCLSYLYKPQTTAFFFIAR